MPIRHFDYFAQEYKWTKQLATGDLAGLRIGVDGSFFIRKLAAIKEPCIAATGGLPLSFKQTLREELSKYKQANIQLFFVFNGLQWKKEKPFSVEDRRPQSRQQAWEYYSAGRADAAYASWSSVSSVPQNDLLFTVFEALDEFGVEYIRAPYAALAQLAYMDKSDRGYFDAVYAGSEYLLFDVDRVITSIDFSKSIVTFIDKQVVLQSLSTTPDLFLDMGILAGFDFISTFPALLDSNSGGFSFQLAVDMVRMHGNGFLAVKNHVNHPQAAKMNYLDLYAKTRCIVKYHLVWKDSGHVQPLHMENAPNDLHELIGMRLPDIVYYYLMRCWISPQVLQTLTTGYLVEPHPLCSGTIEEFRKFITGSEITRLRAQALAFLTMPLNDAYKLRNVQSFVWFDPQTGHSISFGQEILLFDTCKKWCAPPQLMQQAQSFIKCKPTSLEFCITLLANPSFAKMTMVSTKSPPATQTNSNNELLLANMMALAQCNYVDIKTHQLTPVGLAMYKAITSSIDITQISNFFEWMWLLCELLKSGGFQASGYKQSHDLGIENQPETRFIWLLSRIACILPVNTESNPYTGALKRDLLGFHGFMRAMSKSLRNMCEMALMSRLISTKLDHANSSIVQAIPFHEDTSTLMGIIVALYLESCAELAKEKKPSTPEQEQKIRDEALTVLEGKVGAWCKDLKSELIKFFLFWKSVSIFVTEGKNALSKWPGIADDIANFKQADSWIRPFVISNT